MASRPASLLFCVVALLLASLSGTPRATVAEEQPGASRPVRSSASFVRTPLSFEPNMGQTAEHVEYLSRGPGYTLFLTGDQAVLSLRRASDESTDDGAARSGYGEMPDQPSPAPVVVRMSLVGGRPDREVTGIDALPGRSHYFIGNDPASWRTDVPHYAKVEYQEVYEGIDLLYHASQGELEYDFVVSPGADPTTITVAFEGAEDMLVDDGGNLILSVADGTLVQRAPVVYQEIDDRRVPVTSHYVRRSDHTIGFEVGEYDRNRALVIDPVLSYSTFLGGTGYEVLRDIALDQAGYIHVVGYSESLDFPGAPTPPAGAHDVVVSKFDPSGATLLFSTYIGGATRSELGVALAVDPTGVIHITGETTSSDFPTTPGAFDDDYGTHGDGFLTRLSANGSGLVFSTFVGGEGTSRGLGIATDAAGNSYVTGEATSPDFPTTPNAFMPDHPDLASANIWVAAFLMKVGPAGTLDYSTYLGGPDPAWFDTSGKAVAVGADGAVYITGSTEEAGFPATPGAFQTLLGGSPTPLYEGPDAFVAKFDLTQAGVASLVYATFLGGSDNGASDVGYGIVVDAAGNAIVVGSAGSDDFPTTLGSFQPERPFPMHAAFVAKLNADGSDLVFSTFVGSRDSSEFARDIALGADGNLYVTGYTASAHFPTKNPLFPFNNSEESSPGRPRYDDAFVFTMDPAGASLLYSTYLGGCGRDQAWGIAVDGAGSTHIVGTTSSTDYPLASPFQPTYAGGLTDGFVSRIDAGGPSADLEISMAESADPVSVGTELTYTLTVANNGPDAATNVRVLDRLRDTMALVSATPTQGSCYTSCYLTCDLGGLNAGDVATIDVVVSPTSTGYARNEVMVMSYVGDPNTGGAYPYQAHTARYGNNYAAENTSVVSANTPPVAVDMTADIIQNTPSIIALEATDDSSDPLTYLEVSPPSQSLAFLFNLPPGIVTYFSRPDFAGTDSFTFKVNDGFADSNIATVTIESAGSLVDPGDQVLTVTDLPEPGGVHIVASGGANPAQIAICGLPFPPILVPDGADFTLQCGSATLEVTAGSITVPVDVNGTIVPVTLDAGDFVTITEEATITNDGGVAAEVLFDGVLVVIEPGETVPVAPPNSPPSAEDDFAAVTVGAPETIDVLANDTDPDGHALVVTAVTQGARGTVVNDGDAVTYTAGNVFDPLRAEIGALPLNRGQQNSLLAKLRAAERSFERGNQGAGRNQLGALINELEAMKRSGRLDAAVADSLIAYVRAIQSGSLTDTFTYAVSDGHGGTDVATVTVSIGL